jgi:PAS domain S-box-containing protein
MRRREALHSSCVAQEAGPVSLRARRWRRSGGPQRAGMFSSERGPASSATDRGGRAGSIPQHILRKGVQEARNGGSVMRRTSQSGERLPTNPQEPIMSTTERTEAERLASEVLSELPEGIATLAADQSVMSWSPRAELLTGYTLEQIHAVGLVQIFEPAGVIDHLLREAHEGISTFDERVHLRRNDGALVRMHVQCSPLRHLRGVEGQVVVVMREMASLEERLRRDARLTLLGRLAGVLSHEIRNPILLHADILDEELRQPTPDHRTQLAHSMHAIKTERARLQELVQDYLSLARLSEVRREPEDLGAMLQAVGQELQTAVKATLTTAVATQGSEHAR